MVKDSYSVGFWGDFTTGENYQAKYDLTEHINILRQEGYEYLLEKVSNLLTRFDFNIVNLETPLTNVKTSSLEHKKTILHWADGEKVIPLLRKNKVQAVSLGNNHVMDYDKRGLDETLNYLYSADICSFGAGINLQNASLPFIRQITLGSKKFNLYVFGGYKYRKDYDEDFKFYAKKDKEGAFLLTPDTVQESIKSIKNSDKDSVIVVFPHFGFDLMKKTPLQVEYAHGFIDAGADFVIGHGPHMMNSVEKYKGKTILYGLGNFIFPANFMGKVFPYNMGAELKFDLLENGEVASKIRVYPLFMDNQSFKPQTRPLFDYEIQDFMDLFFEEVEELQNQALVEETDDGIFRIVVQ